MKTTTHIFVKKLKSFDDIRAINKAHIELFESHCMLLDACKEAFEAFKDIHGENRNGVWIDFRRTTEKLFNAIQNAERRIK